MNWSICIVAFSLLALSSCKGATTQLQNTETTTESDIPIQKLPPESPCGDWVPYKDERCFKIFDDIGLLTYDEAKEHCAQQENGSRLISISFPDEQKFVHNLLFGKNQVVDNVWIGARYAHGQFVWEHDSSELTFTNWAEGRPRNLTNSCVQILADVESLGKWRDERCRKRNLVVCQKRQTWPVSLQRLQDIVLDARKELRELKQTLIPLGFVYVQLPGEKAPADIWPWINWREVSGNYPGLFFRVVGGDAYEFGQIQEESVPTVTQVKSAHYSSISKGYTAPSGVSTQNFTAGNWSEWIATGAGNSEARYASFFTQANEVRPRNMAMRVWKRVA